uniref:Uncharacterized protein n=1 Tax=Anguilla anguilla TaxID=7936 RepID=A0A0E9Q7F4_ANGAN
MESKRSAVLDTGLKAVQNHLNAPLRLM